jgi:hypothetical protein
MKQIQPISIWINGENKIGEYFQVTCVNDNYENSAINYWQIFAKVTIEQTAEIDGQQVIENVITVDEQLSQGNLSISGEDYINWGDQPAMAINEWIYNWSASQLGLTII